MKNEKDFTKIYQELANVGLTLTDIIKLNTGLKIIQDVFESRGMKLDLSEIREALEFKNKMISNTNQHGTKKL